MENPGEEEEGLATKSSNEILSELFGAFNVEPPKITEKAKSSSSDGEDSDRSKKSKKSKKKKVKKKHKSKGKKHKRKHSNSDSGRESEQSLSKCKKKKRKSKEKSKKVKKESPPSSVNIELPVNQVPKALEIMLDGTVGIKGEDGVMTKIPDANEGEEKTTKEEEEEEEEEEEQEQEQEQEHEQELELEQEEEQQEEQQKEQQKEQEEEKQQQQEEQQAEEKLLNGDATNTVNSDTKEDKIVADDEKTEQKAPVSAATKIPEVFGADKNERKDDKQKKGKIQIRNLKFSSVFQETIKAVEEKQKKEQERRADIEEGELSDSTESDGHMEFEVAGGDKTEDKSGEKKKEETSESKLESDSKAYYKKEDLRIFVKKRKRSRSRGRSASRSRSRTRSRSRSRSRHRSPSSRYRSYDKSRHKRRRTRSRSRDYRRSSYYSRDGHGKRSSSSKTSHHSRSRDRHRSRSRSPRWRDSRDKNQSSHRSKSKEAKERSKTKSKERSKSVEKIDKEKLLAIARKNALKLIDAGVVPGGEKMTTIKAGGKTVNELTEYCKKLSKKEAMEKEKDGTEGDSDSSDGGEKPFHHPFQVRDRPNSIIMNIKNSIPLPVKSLQEKAAEQSKQLRLQFPVSSGSSHRRTENDWIPVSPKREDASDKAGTTAYMATGDKASGNQQGGGVTSSMSDFASVPPPDSVNRSVFPVSSQSNPPVSQVDISSIVSKRLEAMRKLQENPNDSHALNQMYNAQREMQYWAESKQEPGAFTGTTGVRVLTASELSSGAHAWAKRDQLTSATPVSGGMGMALLQKMGWQPGEGLGKNKEGTLEPLRLEIKMDKKGLVASDEARRGSRKGSMMHHGPSMSSVKSLDGKHPVSLLNEYCSRRRYGVPQFELCFECGPDHKKNFLFKVKVNGIEYTPSVASPNKKQAKAEAAAICLRALGVIPGAT